MLRNAYKDKKERIAGRRTKHSSGRREGKYVVSAVTSRERTERDYVSGRERKRKYAGENVAKIVAKINMERRIGVKSGA